MLVLIMTNIVPAPMQCSKNQRNLNKCFVAKRSENQNCLHYVKILNHLEGKKSTCGKMLNPFEYWFTFQVRLSF